MASMKNKGYVGSMAIKEYSKYSENYSLMESRETFRKEMQYAKERALGPTKPPVQGETGVTIITQMSVIKTRWYARLAKLIKLSLKVEIHVAENGYDLRQRYGFPQWMYMPDAYKPLYEIKVINPFTEWRTNPSFELIGVFQTRELAVQYLEDSSSRPYAESQTLVDMFEMEI